MDYDFSQYVEVDFDGTPINEVYLDNTLVWTKPKLLDFSFSGNIVTGYKGSGGDITIPTSYSKIEIKNGNSTRLYFFEGNDYSVTEIGSEAFSGKTSITSVTIPSQITKLGNFCFYNCSNLSSVAMSSTPTSIGQYAFSGTNLSSLSSYMYNCTSLGSRCFEFLNEWTLDIQNQDIASRLVATSNSSDASSGVIYCGVILGGQCSKVGGDDTPSGSETVYYSIDGVEGSITMSVGQTLRISNPTYKVMHRKYVPTIALLRATYSNQSNWSSVSHYLNSSIGVFSGGGLNCSAGQITSRYINSAITATCLVEGTKITLADGTYKNVEDLNYNDLLRVWNLETGKFDIQYPLAIVKGEQHGVKYRLTIEDGTYLEICGQHDIFDPEIHRFRVYGEGAINKIDPNEDYYVMKDIGANEFLSQKIMNIEIIHEDVTAYGIITSGIITSFANDMMIGLGVLNLVPITEENKFDKVFETLKESCYTYDRLVEEIYSDVEKDLAIGLNLLMTDIYHKDASGLPNLVAPFRNRKPLPNYKGKKLHYLALDDGELTTIRSFENELTVLPEIKTPGKTKWYIVGEYKYLEPGDTYITKFSTVIKAV